MKKDKTTIRDIVSDYMIPSPFDSRFECLIDALEAREQKRLKPIVDVWDKWKGFEKHHSDEDWVYEMWEAIRKCVFGC